MKAAQFVVTATLPFCLAGCTGALWGNLLVLGLTIGIFVVTLSLGRRSTEATRSDSSSHSRS